MRLLMYVLTVVVVLAMAVLCLRSCRPRTTPEPVAPAQTNAPAELATPPVPPPSPMPTSTVVVASTPSDTALVATVLTSKPARCLRGTVVDATTKAPIGYAGVALLANATTTIVCDANGGFAFDDVQDGMATLKAWYEDYPTQQFSIFVPPTGATDAVLALMRAARIFGYVYDEYGQPVTACSVTCYRPANVVYFDKRNFDKTTADANGRFDFPQLMLTGLLHISAYDKERYDLVRLTVSPGQEYEVLLVVSNPPPRPFASNGWIHIIAHDTVGAPVSNLSVEVIGHAGSTSFAKKYDANGDYVVGPRAGTCDLFLSSANTPSLYLTNVIVRCEETTTVHAVMGMLTVPVFGEVRRANGMPAAGIKISTVAEDRQPNNMYITVTDAQGEFDFSMVCPDFLYTLALFAMDGIEINQPSEPVKPGDFVHVVLKPYSAIQLQAVASNSLQYIAELGCAFAHEPQGAAESESGSRVGTGAQHKLYLPSSGAYWLTIKAAGYKPVTLQRTFLPDEDVQLGTVYFEPTAQE